MAALDSLAEDCRQRGVRIQRSGDLVQMATAPDAARYVENFLNMDHHQRLSTAGLETLAIVAYKQPITRAGIEAIRGVNSDGAVATLLARDLIEEVGQGRTPGRPVLFGTTVRFLEHFGLERPEDLPPLPEDRSRRGERAMTVGVCRLTLRLPENSSLKGKRQVVKSLIARIRNRYNVSIAEIDNQDSWQIASLGISCVSNSDSHAGEVLTKVVGFVRSSRLDAEVLDWQVELLQAL